MQWQQCDCFFFCLKITAAFRIETNDGVCNTFCITLSLCYFEEKECYRLKHFDGVCFICCFYCYCSYN